MALRWKQTRARDERASRRDDVARRRDGDADQRDRVADEQDREFEKLAVQQVEADPRAAAGLVALGEMRAQAAAERVPAAADRELAASDREAAASDRKLALAELERAHLDKLTGAYRREMGEIALLQEIERAQLSRGTLVLAYIDFDGLKETNDRHGHAAGDAFLRDLVTLLRARLRFYDPVVRWGGDEFICTISDVDLATASDRFGKIRKALDTSQPGARVTVGLAALREDDTLEALIERADAALLDARQRR